MVCECGHDEIYHWPSLKDRQDYCTGDSVDEPDCECNLFNPQGEVNVVSCDTCWRIAQERCQDSWREPEDLYESMLDECEHDNPKEK